MAGLRNTHEELTSAAIDLFLANGYEETTADEIAEAAGVARRTFFRYFRAKEDAVLPDHEGCLARVRELLERNDSGESPFATLTRASHLVLALYAQDPAKAVRRYELMRRVESLREREIMMTGRYQRVFAEYLYRVDTRIGDSDEDDDRLRHDVTAAAMVAAHNHVLRQWIRDGGGGDVHARLDAALDLVEAAMRGWQGENATDQGELLVVVARPGTPVWRLAQSIQSAAGSS
ncbi:MAG TPA: TetR family transcriptional regulator [Micromonosporaceae bacterium]|nr:TetR family transcriptional regulator [Micromonosporaceae bacterium]HCU49686.1 TetR family transcriptional regulator [Micromonosporaceae bacterium]